MKLFFLLNLKASPYKAYSMNHSKRDELYFSKQNDAASYCPARNTKKKSKNTLFSALLLLKRSVICFISKMPTKCGCTQKLLCWGEHTSLRERKKALPQGKHLTS